MIRGQNRSAWIWVAFAAIALASVARAESGLESARSYAHPVLEFFAGNHAGQPAAIHGSLRQAQRGNAWQAKAASQNEFAGTWLAMLPVLFVGVVSPLNQLSPRSIRRTGGVPHSPLLPASFQRPPPQLA